MKHHCSVGTSMSLLHVVMMQRAESQTFSGLDPTHDTDIDTSLIHRGLFVSTMQSATVVRCEPSMLYVNNK